MKSLFYLNKYLLKYKWHLLFGLLFIIASNYFGVYMPKIIDDAIDNFYLSSIFAIAGSAQSALYKDGIWVGSLEYLKPSSGYWLVTFNDILFQFNQPDYDMPPITCENDRSNPQARQSKYRTHATLALPLYTFILE